MRTTVVLEQLQRTAAKEQQTQEERVVSALDPNKDQLVNLVEFTNAFSKILNAAGSGAGSSSNVLKDS